MTRSHNLELRKEWEQRISDYKASGQSQAKWCEDNGVSYHQFGYWKKSKRQIDPTYVLDGAWVII